MQTRQGSYSPQPHGQLGYKRGSLHSVDPFRGPHKKDLEYFGVYNGAPDLGKLPHGIVPTEPVLTRSSTCQEQAGDLMAVPGGSGGLGKYAANQYKL